MESSKKYHTFENGISIYDDQLAIISDIQREKYKIRNVLEAEEEDIFINTIQNLPLKAIYLNIGSAFGYYSLLAKKLRSDLIIYCFEPLPIHINYFKRNIDLNKFDKNNFIIINKAVSDKNGTAEFIVNSYGSSINFIKNSTLIYELKIFAKRIINFSGIRKFNITKIKYDTIIVQTITLNDIDKEIAQKIDLVQMDIQGAEAIVLNAFFKTSIESNIKTFLIGTHGEQIHKKCINCLTKNNYIPIYDIENPPNQPDGIILASK